MFFNFGFLYMFWNGSLVILIECGLGGWWVVDSVVSVRDGYCIVYGFVCGSC